MVLSVRLSRRVVVNRRRQALLRGHRASFFFYKRVLQLRRQVLELQDELLLHTLIG